MSPAARLIVCVAAIATIHLGCNGKTPTTPTRAVGNALQRLEIEVPASFPSERRFLPGDPSSPALVLAPGTSLQLTARGYLADGSSRDVTGEVTWRSFWAGPLDPVATVGQGLVEAKEPGRTIIGVESGPRGASKEILVRLDGTFALRGSVRDARTGQAMSNAVVAAMSGQLPHIQSSTTSSDGSYVLWSVPPVADITASKPGFKDKSHRVALKDHNARLDFILDEETPLVRLAGTYTLVITADANCSIEGRAFPDELRRRTYTAVVTQTGNELTVALSGATFHRHSGAQFSGRVTPGLAIFQLTSMYWMTQNDGDVVEQLSPFTFLTISGTAAMSTSSLSGRLDGTFWFEIVEPGLDRDWSNCTSQNHQFQMLR